MLFGIGKIILATSIILFVMATNGGKDFTNSEVIISQKYPDLTSDEIDKKAFMLILGTSR